jgi:hypothetical protein
MNRFASIASAFVLSFGAVICAVQPVWAQFVQQGAKLVGTGATGVPFLGWSVSVAADDATILVGGPGDSSGIGAAWVFVRSGGVWTQQGPKLVGTIGRAVLRRRHRDPGVPSRAGTESRVLSEFDRPRPVARTRSPKSSEFMSRASGAKS